MNSCQYFFLCVEPCSHIGFHEILSWDIEGFTNSAPNDRYLRQKEWHTDQLLLPWIFSVLGKATSCKILLLLLKSGCSFAHINVSSCPACFRTCLSAIIFSMHFYFYSPVYECSYITNFFVLHSSVLHTFKYGVAFFISHFPSMKNV